MVEIFAIFVPGIISPKGKNVIFLMSTLWVSYPQKWTKTNLRNFKHVKQYFIQKFNVEWSTLTFLIHFTHIVARTENWNSWIQYLREIARKIILKIFYEANLWLWGYINSRKSQNSKISCYSPFKRIIDSCNLCDFLQWTIKRKNWSRAFALIYGLFLSRTIRI